MVLQSCFAVVPGGPQETGKLLEHKFDYIFFTGEVTGGGVARLQDLLFSFFFFLWYWGLNSGSTP
jgi:hypothetical protein